MQIKIKRDGVKNYGQVIWKGELSKVNLMAMARWCENLYISNGTTSYNGKLLLHTSNLTPQTSIDISHLPAGLYLLKISTEAGKVIKKGIERIVVA